MEEFMEELLVVKNIRKTFALSKKQQEINKTTEKYKVAVDGLSFIAYKGEIYGLLGPNGSGKTTTLRIISTLIKSDEGDCFISNISVKNNPDLIRRKIGFLTSELKLEDFFTPNYLFDYFSNLHQIPVEERNKRKDYLFRKFQIEDFKEVKVPTTTHPDAADITFKIGGLKFDYSLTVSFKDFIKKYNEQ
jgi:sodium transport system ATP-binding protein